MTDNLAKYLTITENLVVEHQVFQFYVNRWVGRTLKELVSKLSEQWLLPLERIKLIMEEVPADGGKQLLELYKQLSGQLKRGKEHTTGNERPRLLISLSESWERYTAFFQDPIIP